MGRVSCAVLIVLVIVAILHVQPLLAEVDIGNGESVHGLYTIHRYGNVILLLLNRSALRYVDGFWVLVLEDIDHIDISAKILDVVGDPVVEAVDMAVENGELRTLRGKMSSDVREVVSALVSAGLRNAMIRISILRSGSLWLRIECGGFEELGVEKLVKALTSVTRGRRVVVEEVITLCSLPSFFDAQDMYEALMSLPCFSSVGEGAYGRDIVFDLKCAQKIASEKSTSLDQVIEDIVSELRKVMPLVKKYTSCREFLVIFEEVKPMIPLAEVVPITKTS
ncbi:MAG: hypothetical protein DRO12_00995, partial [Thermoprotei archaeon]